MYKRQLMYYTSRRNLMPGKEYGTAKFADINQVNKTIKNKDEHCNRILSPVSYTHLAYHFIISFGEGEVDDDTAFEITQRFAKEYIGNEYEVVFSVHNNTDHKHGHIIFNSVNMVNGKKYRYEKGDWAKYIQPLTNRLCEEYGLSTIDISADGKGINERYKDWNPYRDGKFIWKDMVMSDVDSCIVQASTYDSFLELMEEKGSVSYTHLFISTTITYPY